MDESIPLRRQAWAFFASAFNELPTIAFVQSLREAAAMEETSCLANREFVAWLSALSDQDALDEIGKDRARLLRYVDSFCINPPYESLYAEKSEQAVLSDLHAFFLEVGFEPTGELHEPADYIGMEIAFLEECCAQAVQALDAGDESRVERLMQIHDDFLTRHPGSWALEYAHNMYNAATTPFYRLVAELLIASMSNA